MSAESVSILRGLYAAYARKDLPAIFEVLDPEIDVFQSELLPWGGRYHGHEEVKSFFAKLIEHIDSRVHVDRFVDAGDHVVAVGRSRGRVKATGKQFEVDAVHVWTMRGGKAVRFEAYIDTPTMVRFLET